MAILTDSRCLLCHFHKNIDTARGLGTEAQATAFARELMKIYLDSPADVGATWYGPATAELFDRIYGVGPDRFVEEKRRSNAFVLERMEQIRDKIERAKLSPVYRSLTDDQKILEKIDEEDMIRRNYHKIGSDTEWGVKETYDLCINSDELGRDYAGWLLAQLMTGER